MMWPFVAYALVLGVPAAGSVVTFLALVQQETGVAPVEEPQSYADIAFWIGVTLTFGMIVGVALTRFISRRYPGTRVGRDWLADRARRGGWGGLALTAGVPWLILSVTQPLYTYLAEQFIGVRALAVEQTIPPLWFVIVSATWAGFGEELFVVALPIVALAYVVEPRNFWRAFWYTWPILVAARMIYHAYYGWGFLQFLPWAMAVPILYALYRRVWPLIVMHSAYNVLNDLDGLGYLPTTVHLTIVIGVGTALTIAGIAFNRRGAQAVKLLSPDQT